jgi:hypothetical protein
MNSAGACALFPCNAPLMTVQVQIIKKKSQKKAEKYLTRILTDQFLLALKPTCREFL